MDRRPGGWRQTWDTTSPRRYAMDQHPADYRRGYEDGLSDRAYALGELAVEDLLNEDEPANWDWYRWGQQLPSSYDGMYYSSRVDAYVIGFADGFGPPPDRDSAGGAP